MVELAELAIQFIQAPVQGAHPQLALQVDIKHPGRIVAQAGGVLRGILIGQEMIPVKPVESVLRAEPDETLRILGDAHDRVLR